MKTTALMTRVTTCFLVSFIPATELENRIYSARMEARHFGQKPVPDIIMVEIQSPHNPSHHDIEVIREQLLTKKPSLVLFPIDRHWNQLLRIDPDGTVRQGDLFLKNRPPSHLHSLH